MRVVAASMICMSHLWMIFPVQNQVLTSIFKQFHIGVNFFFVLSGFLMAYLYSDSFVFNRTYCLNFYRKRLIRIYPIYLLIVLNVLLREPHELLTWLVNLSMMKGYFLLKSFAGISASWTITVDLTFYLLVPLIFLLWKRIHWLLLVCFFYILSFSFYVIGANIQWHAFYPSQEFAIYSTFFGRSFEFLLGMALGIKILHSKKVKRFSFPMKTITGVGVISIGLWILVLFQQNVLNPWRIITSDYIISLGVACLIWGLVTERSLLQRVLSHKWMVLLGDAAYVFFLLHFTPFSLDLYRFLDNNFWLLIIALWVISWFLYRYVEKPIAAHFS